MVRGHRSHDGLEILSRAECLVLLRNARLGRVAVTTGALPDIFPVRYGVIEEDIVFRTSPGTKHDTALMNAMVAFEADHLDDLNRGWSVVVVGVARHVTDPGELAALANMVPTTVTPGHRPHLVRIDTAMISGRRIPGHDDATARPESAPDVRVLVVDDDDADRRLVTKLLTGEPRFTVVGEAPHGAGALQLAEALRPDVVILDYEMPGLDGLEIAARLFQHQPSPLVVLCARSSHPALPRVAAKLGISGYVDKKNLRRLVTVVDQVVLDQHSDP